jgi:tripartite-type tricarboxylate transporter receptor subunit TctC
VPIARRAALAAALAAPLAANAQGLPAKSVRIIVPTGAGGITDILARLMAERLAERIGQPVVVENRGGAGGVIGTEAAARAEPDGTTLLMAFPSHMLNPGLKARLPYDTERAFAPISTVTTVSLVLIVPPGLPARSLPELIALARRDRLTYASVGAGSLGHLGAELFRSMAGIELTHIPYRAAPEAHTALLRGDVSMFFDTPITAIPQIREGKLRGLGVSSLARSPALPEVPTIAEALPGYEVLGWNGLLAPAGTPAPIVERLGREIRAIVTDAAMARRLAELGTDPAPSTPEEFATRIRTDIAKWTRVIREAGISPE